MKTKICFKCGIEKPFNEFGNDKKFKDGKYYQCRLCRKSEINKEKYLRKKELEQQGLKECCTCHIIKPISEFVKHCNKKDGHSSQCKQCMKNKSKVFYLEHSNYYKQYQKEHKIQLLIYQAKYSKNKLKTEIIFKITKNLRNRFWNAIKKNWKSGYTLELLGCSVDFLKKHLESQFKEGMSWDNYGKNGWHIDHIKPLSSFNLNKKEEIYKCWNYKNLQPWWWYENIKKRSLK
jgi:hypothetical protein